MSRKVEIPTLAELSSSRKRKRSKGKEIIGEGSAPQEAGRLEAMATPKPLAGSAPQLKRSKPWGDADEDLENVIVKVPRGASVFSDPSELQKFAGGLLLEGDEERLVSLGPVESAKKGMTHAFEVSLPTVCTYLVVWFFYLILVVFCRPSSVTSISRGWSRPTKGRSGSWRNPTLP